MADAPDTSSAVAAVADVPVAVTQERKKTSRAKLTLLETPATTEPIAAATMAAPAEAPTISASSEVEPVPAIAEVTPSFDIPAIDEVPLVAAPRKLRTTDLADLIDSLRGRSAPSEDAEPEDALPPAAVELFERCANDYRRESDKLVDRRRRIGTLVYPTSPEQANVISAFFVQSLGLRIVDLDTQALTGFSNEDAAVWLATLKEPTAHIVALHGLGPASDPRVFAAIESAEVDVLVLGFADPGATFSAGVQRCLKYRIDLQQTLALQVDLGCFDDASSTERRNGRPDPGQPSDRFGTTPGKGHGLFERILRFFRADARAAGS